MNANPLFDVTPESDPFYASVERIKEYAETLRETHANARTSAITMRQRAGRKNPSLFHGFFKMSEDTALKMDTLKAQSEVGKILLTPDEVRGLMVLAVPHPESRLSITYMKSGEIEQYEKTPQEALRNTPGWDTLLKTLKTLPLCIQDVITLSRRLDLLAILDAQRRAMSEALNATQDEDPR